MDTSDNDFEWELSKENVARLRGGRSVTLLNKALSSCHSVEFNQKRQEMRRYLRWVEQTYPSIRCSANLENLMFRCVRDVGQLAGVQNEENFVYMWIRLTEYCDQPAAMFELLFRQGVGTMCAKFYNTWADVLKSKMQYRRTAAVYAHGLRAGALPLYSLEDHAEAFTLRYQNHYSAVTEPDLSTPAVAPVRQTLAALRLIDDGRHPGTETQTKAPVLRTIEHWHADQSGLSSANNSFTSKRGLQPRPNVRPTVCTDSTAVPDPTSLLLHTLTPAERGFGDNSKNAPIRPLGLPSNWQKENTRKAVPWINEKLPTVTPRVPDKAPQWEIFSEQDVEQSSSSAATECRYVKQVQEVQKTRIRETNVVNQRCLRTQHRAASTADTASKLIYGGAEEVCWEMVRAMKLFSGKSLEINHDSWDDEERQILQEIERILAETEEQTQKEFAKTVVPSNRIALIKTLEAIAMDTNLFVAP